MVLPELDIRMRAGGILRTEAQRRHRGIDRQKRAGRKIQPHSRHILRRHGSLTQNLRDRLCEHIQIILRVLQRVVMRQRRSVGQGVAHHPVGIIRNRTGNLSSRSGFHQQSAPGKRTEIQTNYIFHLFTPKRNANPTARRRAGLSIIIHPRQKTRHQKSV